jgi:hypothetical protein
MNSSDILTPLAEDRVTAWLVQQGKGRLASQLENFLKHQTKNSLDELLDVAVSSDMEYGFFAGAGAFWFRNSQTGEYITVAFVDSQSGRLVIVINGVSGKTNHLKYPSMVRFEPFTIERVSMWRDEKKDSAIDSHARCCESGPSQLQVVTSIDPNDLLAGPEGVGDKAYIAEEQSITYTIRFENPPEARSPAIDVTVTVQLDPAIDMGSLLVGESSHPDVMNIEIDESGNTITWLFKNINLPPNQEPTEGEGWVRFSVKPLPDLPSGTAISAKAALRFDFNPPIETNEIIYTVDSAPPSTRVSALPSVQLNPSFPVPWEGTDDPGSGIGSVALMVSKNGGPFEVWETTSGPSLPFRGEPGATYGFATLGVDRVGHAEPTPTEPDVVVAVGQPLTYEKGLYLLGVPVMAQDNPGNLWASPGSVWSAWDSLRQSYVPLPSLPERVLGDGLWVRFEEDTAMVITGQPVPGDRPYPIRLRPGWNLIASPFTLELPWSLDKIKVQANGEEKTLREAQASDWMEDFAWGWDGESYTLVYDSAMVPGVASELKPFHGYWVQAHQDVTLILPPPAP